MLATQMLATFLAMAAVNFEFAHDGLTRNLGLKLLIETVFDDLAATIGALLGQRRFEFFIDAFWWRHFAMGVLAMLIARFASRLFRLLLGLALGERSGLSFCGTFEFFDALFELRIFVAEMLILAEQLFVGRSIHADLVSDGLVSCTRLSRFVRPRASRR